MLIKLGNIGKKDILLLILPIITTIEAKIELEILEQKKFNLYYNQFLKHLTNTLCGFFWVFRVKNNLRETEYSSNDSNSNKENSNNIDRILTKDSSPSDNSDEKGKSAFELNLEAKRKKMRKKKIEEIFYFAGMSILFLVSTFLYSAIENFKINEKDFERLITLNIMVRVVLTALFNLLLIPESKLYKHHILSLITICIVVLLFNLISVLLEKNSIITNTFLTSLTIITPDILFSMFYVFGKHYTLFSYKSIYKLLFAIGIVCTITVIISQFIRINNACEIYRKVYHFLANSTEKLKEICDPVEGFESLFSYLGHFDLKYWLLTILLIILYLIETNITWHLIIFFSPNHYSASFSLCEFIKPILIKNFRNYSKTLHILYGFSSVIIIFAVLVFNEFIILMFFGIEENTKIEISKRAKKDYMQKVEKADYVFRGSLSTTEMLIDESGLKEQELMKFNTNEENENYDDNRNSINNVNEIHDSYVAKNDSKRSSEECDDLTFNFKG